MNSKERIETIMARFEVELEECERQLLQAGVETGARLRHILVPILHRWGIGMLRGGMLQYRQPNLQEPGIGNALMPKDADYALGELHPTLAKALWEETDIRQLLTFHYYVDDIPLPDGVEYIWITKTALPGPLGRPLSSIRFTPYTYQPTTQPTVYYGPVTQAYLDDITRYRDGKYYQEFLYTLPSYVIGDGGQYVKVLPKEPPVTAVPALVVTTYKLYYGADSSYGAISDAHARSLAISLQNRDVYTSNKLVVEEAITLMLMGAIPYSQIYIESTPIIDGRGNVVQWDGWPSEPYKRLMVAALCKLSSEAKN